MWARVEQSIVKEIIEDVADFPIEQRFPHDFVAKLIACPSGVEQGWTYDGEVFKPPIEPQEDLEEIKRSLAAVVDNAAETERLKYITPGAGQALTYQQKSEEAKRYLAATDPDPADYPLLSAEMGITAADLAGVARIVNAAFAQWQIIGAAIEKTRLATKAAIDAAATAEEAQTAFEGASWPII